MRLCSISIVVVFTATFTLAQDIWKEGFAPECCGVAPETIDEQSRTLICAAHFDACDYICGAWNLTEKEILDFGVSPFDVLDAECDKDSHLLNLCVDEYWKCPSEVATKISKTVPSPEQPFLSTVTQAARTTPDTLNNDPGEPTSATSATFFLDQNVKSFLAAHQTLGQSSTLGPSSTPRSTPMSTLMPTSTPIPISTPAPEATQNANSRSSNVPKTKNRAGGLTTGEKVGIGIGVLSAVVITTALVFWYLEFRRRGGKKAVVGDTPPPPEHIYEGGLEVAYSHDPNFFRRSELYGSVPTLVNIKYGSGVPSSSGQGDDLPELEGQYSHSNVNQERWSHQQNRMSEIGPTSPVENVTTAVIRSDTSRREVRSLPPPIGTTTSGEIDDSIQQSRRSTLPALPPIERVSSPR
ncbi:hypothetical protein P154DRAFT_622750 [Amniculicola lignicola CBS 123094]|uniref:Extracellular membrane protein CFEM domain-containing protein n=1 Tax=Amniculicola lignicola CBS 123094 TaxID=1392246 RepID=A0A6A5W8H3_9PLEO|nr:hypothetical protein P154DRAFT_622750 [Amniculicola lignicola CBS 123094]